MVEHGSPRLAPPRFWRKETCDSYQLAEDRLLSETAAKVADVRRETASSLGFRGESEELDGQCRINYEQDFHT